MRFQVKVSGCVFMASSQARHNISSARSSPTAQRSHVLSAPQHHQLISTAQQDHMLSNGVKSQSPQADHVH